MLDVRLKTAEQTVAVGGSLSKDTAGRSVCHWRPLGQNLREALGPDSTERQLKEYRQAKSFSDFWKSYRPVFEDDPSHQQVGKSSGELAQQVRRTRAASQSERMLHLTTKLFVEWYNEAIT